MTGVSIELVVGVIALVIALVAFKTIIAAGNPASSPRSPYRDAEASTSPGRTSAGQDRSRESGLDLTAASTGTSSSENAPSNGATGSTPRPRFGPANGYTSIRISREEGGF